MYYIKIKCQRMVGQCPACPIGRAIADTNIIIISLRNSEWIVLTLSNKGFYERSRV